MQENKLIHIGSMEGYEINNRVYGVGGVSPTIETSNPKKIMETEKVHCIKIKQATKGGFALLEIGGVADLEYPNSETRRGRVIGNGQVAPTTTTTPYLIEFGNPDFYNFLYEFDGEIYLIRIRKLTPKECGRLMGVDNASIDRMLEINSNTQCYKQFGNSIVTTVLMGIFSQLGISGVKKWNDMSDSEIHSIIQKKR